MIKDTSKFPPHKYEGEPYEHQRTAVNNTWMLPHYALFWEMGAGKTKPILDTAAKLFLAGEIDGLWVVCDNGAYRNWLDYEIPRHMMRDIPIRAAAWSSSMRSAEQHVVNQLLRAVDDVLDILVMPVEAFSGGRAPLFAQAFLQAHYALGVVDESSSIKNIQAKRTQELIRLGGFCDYKRIMTGTPVLNHPIDLYSQFEFLAPGLLGFNSYTCFRNYYCKLMLTDMGKGRKFYQIVGYQNLDMLTKSIQPHSSRILKSECLDLPEKIYEEHAVEHTLEQRRAYDDLRQTAVLQDDRGLVTVTSALTMLGKLHQINCGHVKSDDGTVMDLPSNRINELMRLIELIDGKVIVWAHFVRDIELICERMSHDEIDHVHYYGATSPDDRVIAIDTFRNDPDVKCFVSNQATGGKGITLVESCNVIYYSQSFSLGLRLQSEDRCHRPGQYHAVTYTDLIVPGTVDVKIVRALKEKKDLATTILDSYRDLLC